VPHIAVSETEDTQYCNSPTESDIMPEEYWASKSGRYLRLAGLDWTLQSIPASSAVSNVYFSCLGQ